MLSRSSALPTYDPKKAEGFWRHLVIRKGKNVGECMLIFSVNAVWKEEKTYEKATYEFFIVDMIKKLTEKYENIASVYLLENTGRADIVTGKSILLFGKPSIDAELLGLNFEIQPKSFFQVNTLGAEKLYTLAIDFIQSK
jgi:tRNA/tmRNA/rRNA uracil-C5-methylase (TrmA/RlmC/RlmD family)